MLFPLEKIIQLAERLADDVRHFDNPVNDTDYTVAKVHEKSLKFVQTIKVNHLQKMITNHVNPVDQINILVQNTNIVKPFVIFVNVQVI